MKYLIKLDRWAAWILFISLLLYFITGFGMTKGIISVSFATKLHTNYLTYIILTAFVLHTGFATHLAFKRWKFWNASGKTVWVLFYLIFIAFFIYVDRFYTRSSPKTNVSININVNTNLNTNSSIVEEENDDEDENNRVIINSNNQNSNINANTNSQIIINNTNNQMANTNQPALKTFSLAELAQYNGQNGQPAYVAVDGVVYDVSSVFVEGNHFSHLAGQELTEEFYSQHVKAFITKYPVVGILQ